MSDMTTTASTVYYLPGHGGHLESGLGQALRQRGFNLTGRETVGEFRRLRFTEQVDMIAEDLTSSHWHEESRVVANSFGAYLFLHAQSCMKPYLGRVLLLSPIVGQFSDDENSGLGFIPPRAERLSELAEAGTYPTPMHCEIHVGELDWQSNPTNVLKLADRIGLPVTVVPKAGHMLGKPYVSALLDRWL